MLSAQKVLKKVVLDTNISLVQIDANNCFEINLETTNGHELVVEATIDGEYKKDLLLTMKEDGTTLHIGGGFQQNFINPNDKLSAHKVISIALRITLPKNKNVAIYGTSCNLMVKGAYKKLDVSLNDGSCDLYSIVGAVVVHTQSGDITANSAAATINSASKYGAIESENIPVGDNQYDLSTVTGDIHLKRIE